MINKTLFAVAFSFISAAAAAENWVVGGDYVKLGGISAVAASGGYKIPLNQENSTILVGGRYGVGMGDDNGVEMDSLLGAFVKYQYDIDSEWYIQGIAAYTQFEYSFDYNYFGFNYSASGSDSELSVGFGGGYRINDESAVEFSYENFDYDGAISLGYRYEF